MRDRLDSCPRRRDQRLRHSCCCFPCQATSGGRGAGSRTGAGGASWAGVKEEAQAKVRRSANPLRPVSDATRAERVGGSCGSCAVLPCTAGAPGSGGLLCLLPLYAYLRLVALATDPTVAGVRTAPLQVVEALTLVTPQLLLGVEA